MLAVALVIALWAPWRVGKPADPKLLTRLDADLGSDAITANYNTFAISPEGDRLVQVFTIRGADGKTRLASA